jgi:hypothetical protein
LWNSRARVQAHAGRPCVGQGHAGIDRRLRWLCKRRRALRKQGGRRLADLISTQTQPKHFSIFLKRTA